MKSEHPQINDIATAKTTGHKGHGKYKWIACPLCHKERWVALIKGGVIGSPYCRKCTVFNYNKQRTGDKSTMWKGGKRSNNGYIIIYLPENHKFYSMCSCIPYVLEHRLVMAENIGRPLLSEEIVHHKDGDRSNNNINNLELTERGKHSKEHSKGYRAGFEKGYLDGLKEAGNGKINNN